MSILRRKGYSNLLSPPLPGCAGLKRGRKRKSSAIEPEEPESGPEVAYAAKEVTTGKKNYSR